jgi:thioredoxin-related protein
MKIQHVLSLVIFCVSLGLANIVHADFFDDSWGDLREDLKLAKETGQKGLFLFYEMDECPFCSRMKTKIFTQKDVQDYMKPRFRILSIDIEGDTELTDFAGNTSTSKVFAQTNNRVRATPVMIFYDLEGNTLYRHTGPLRDAQEFLWLAQYIDQGLYTKQRFNQYLREQRKAASN